MPKAACACAKAALDLNKYQLILRHECIQALDVVLPSAVDGNDLVWALARALADAEKAAAARREAERAREKSERDVQKAVEQAEKEAAKALTEAAKAVAKARAKEEAQQKKQSAEEAARAATEAKHVAREEAREAERHAKAEVSAQKQAAKEMRESEAAERKAAAERVKAEAERIKAEASEIALREREQMEAEARAAREEACERDREAEMERVAAEKERAAAEKTATENETSPRAEGWSTATSISQQRLERAHSRLSNFMPRSSSTTADDVGEEGGGASRPVRTLRPARDPPSSDSSAFKMMSLGGRKLSAVKALENEQKKVGDDVDDAAVIRLQIGDFGAGDSAHAWRGGGARSLQFDVTSDCIAVHGEDEIICSVCGGLVCVYSLAKEEVVSSLSGHTDRVICVTTLERDEINGDDYIIASGSRDRTIRLWSRASGACLKVLKGSGESVYSLAMHGHAILSGEPSSHQGAIAKARLWSVAYNEDGRVSSATVKTVFEHGGPVWSVALSASVAITASDDGTARLWPLNGASTRSLATLKHPAWVCSVSLCAEDALCATGCGDSKIRLWSVAAGLPTSYTCLATFDHCAGSSGTYPMRVRWLAGGALVSSGLDGVVRVWTLSSSGEATSVANLPHEDNVRGLAVSPSLGFIASSGGGKAKAVVVWRPKR